MLGCCILLVDKRSNVSDLQTKVTQARLCFVKLRLAQIVLCFLTQLGHGGRKKLLGKKAMLLP